MVLLRWFISWHERDPCQKQRKAVYAVGESCCRIRKSVQQDMSDNGNDEKRLI